MGRTRIGIEIAVILAGVLLLGGLLVSISGRLASGLLPFIPQSFDRRLGEALFASFSVGARACPDPRAESYVKSLAEPLEKVRRETEYPLHFFVADDPSPNAFALPGGFVIVNRGLVETAADGSEVAGVLAHEIEHVDLRHATSRALHQMSGSILFQLFFLGPGFGTAAQIYNSLGQSSFSRDQESAADREGAKLLQRAGIDPKALGRYLTRLSSDAPQIPVWLSTHPDSPERAKALESFVLTSPAVPLPPPAAFHCGVDSRDKN